ncbi:MAG: HD domain-containing protein [Blautia sp.]|uniref:HD domain-containing protein n=1 Tax=Blautia sp. TaxID=1955243 RepID=UPI002E78BA25|nr:HD domain-containing protein [Blautia sp.]MEE1442486.1 HD domain-containing protein [Blautia sp.]
MDERLKKQMDFLLEVDKLKFIYRQTYLSNGERKENDAEHSWHLALMAVLLQEYSNEPVDVVKVMTMVLIHDLVEIDAGDTYAYDTAGNQTKREREVKAAQRIFGILPKDQEEAFRALWEEFEAYETPEAKFAHVCDNMQPFMLNHATGGRSWQEHGVKKSQVLNRNRYLEDGSKTMKQYFDEIIEEHVKEGNLKDE